MPLGIFLVALLALSANVGNPPQVIFDEAWYVQWGREVARDNLLRDIKHDNVTLRDIPINYEHPPLAKHLIAWSLQGSDRGQLDLTWDQFYRGCDKAAQLTPPQPCPDGRTWVGCDHANEACRREAQAWRLPNVLVGAAGIAFAYLLGLRLFDSLTGGLASAALLLLDNLWYLQSRVALLDVFSASFALGALAFALHPSRPTRIAAGLLMGAAMASKYPGLFLLPPFLLLTWLTQGAREPWRRAAFTVLWGLGLPFLVFVLSYSAYLGLWIQAEDVGYAIGQFIAVQGLAAAQDFGFTFKHCSSSPPWMWIPHLNLTFYYYPTHPNYQPPLIYALGNHLLWWTTTAAALTVPVAILIRWLRVARRHHLNFDTLRALAHYHPTLTPTLGLFLASTLLIASYLPWFILQRTQFNYYATLNVPYFALIGGGLAAWAWPRSRPWRIATISYVALTAVWFAIWWPLVGGADVPKSYLDALWTLVPWQNTWSPPDCAS